MASLFKDIGKTFSGAFPAGQLGSAFAPVTIGGPLASKFAEDDPEKFGQALALAALIGGGAAAASPAAGASGGAGSGFIGQQAGTAGAAAAPGAAASPGAASAPLGAEAGSTVAPTELAVRDMANPFLGAEPGPAPLPKELPTEGVRAFEPPAPLKTTPPPADSSIDVAGAVQRNPQLAAAGILAGSGLLANILKARAQAIAAKKARDVAIEQELGRSRQEAIAGSTRGELSSNKDILQGLVSALR